MEKRLVKFKDELITFETARLAKEKGFDWECRFLYHSELNWEEGKGVDYNWNSFDSFSAPTQTLLQRFIRETRGVHIEIHRNASGYYWGMCKSNGGTDLGWSDQSGPNHSGVWDSNEEALENAMFVQLSFDLPENTRMIGHWGNYVVNALKNLIIN
tara:strand:- start:1261 stop:1728 length:468 start_codon:yes stop_codon:yes gene_type:complete